MIGKLRRKFILVSMVSVFAVLLAIVAVINLMNFHNVTVRADQILELLAENEGRFPGPPPQDASQDAGARKDTLEPPLSPETPYETRFFTVTLDAEGQVQSVDTGHIAALTDEATQVAFPVPKGEVELAEAINEALNELREDGTLAQLSEKYFGSDITQIPA